MRNLSHLDEYRITLFGDKGGPTWGAFDMKLPMSRLNFRVIASDGMGWDHVSVSTQERCPKWEEMSYIKDLFFEEEDAVMQLHPPRSQYVNNHPTCLHLWRPQKENIPLPHWSLVGIKKGVL